MSKSLILLVLLAVSAFAVPNLRAKRAPEPQTEAIDGTTSELSPGDDTPAQFEEEASGEEEHHEHHMEASGEAPEKSSSVAAPMEPKMEEPKMEEPKIEETTTEETLSKEPEADEKPIEAATVISSAEETPSTTEVPMTSSEEPATSSETPVSSATSFVSSLFVLVCVYLIAM
ncbi:Protein CBG17682 [Caenorhabditis briggsae]|uniref:Uncharacterized protein n=2 Tax=Caenorhabditis briggsae TaxID=6238 RepID=A0AAE9AIM1_CAEBR|nr:Protein CBG17682 [Caenorhabditis briggsae]ULT96811.1 hypothetical protein L3Y34_004971 [Caenorhabditis briggsae]UMM29985.1 hypothetical protein L5515_012065 [Caenorhabditis briggsae]CAP35264.1 Protein CBG17682 [Caenorhabditis briggsae]